MLETDPSLQSRAGVPASHAFGPMDTFPAVIAALARKTPEKILLHETSGRALTCGAFHESVLTWASALQRLGVTEGRRVAVMLPNPIDALACWLGLAWLRAVETPINLQFHGRMLAYVINDAAADFVVAAARFLPAIAAVAAELKCVRTVVAPDLRSLAAPLPFRLVGAEEFLRDVEPLVGLEAPARHEISTMLYTGGTTGPSKGVLIPWGLWTDSQDTAGRYLGEQDVTYDPLPMFHGGGKSLAQIAIRAGSSVVLREHFRTEDFWDDVRRWGCTFAALFPAMAEWLLARTPQPDDGTSPLRRVAMVPIIPRVQEFKTRFGVQVQTSYGMTEIGLPMGTVTFTPDVTGNWQSCGRVGPAYEARIVNSEDYEVPDGVVGELVVRSRLPWGLMCGYFGRPEATAAAWRNGWLHTGDAFRRDADGNLYFVDRMKDALRRRGENVSSFEVEAHVNEHPDVLESAVIGVPSEFGEDEIKVYVIIRPGAAPNPTAMLGELATRLPRFMVPRYLEFIEALPRTEATLRVQKVKLRENWRNRHTWDQQMGRYLDHEDPA